jgi:hypothetical protein
MPDLDPIAPSFPVPPVIKDEPAGRFRRPIIPPPDADDSEETEETDANPAAEQPRKPADDGHIDEYV